MEWKLTKRAQRARRTTITSYFVVHHGRLVSGGYSACINWAARRTSNSGTRLAQVYRAQAGSKFVYMVAEVDTGIVRTLNVRSRTTINRLRRAYGKEQSQA